MRATAGDRFGIKLLLATLLVTALVFAWTSIHYRHATPAHQTHTDQAGRLQVLGITLGKSTLREAEVALQSRSDTALYLYPRSHARAGMHLEAFFPSIADHTKVILELRAGPQLLRQLQQRATLPHQYPDEVLRMNLAGSDLMKVQQLPVSELTLIPSSPLDEATLARRFGQPDERRQESDGSLTLRFKRRGLTASLRDAEAAVLHFANPLPAQ